MATQVLPWSNLHWHEVPMPDANAGVRLAALQPAGADQFLAMVQFPPGWQRLRDGHYTVDEEFFVLSGDLRINSQRWCDQQHGFVPANTLRTETRSVGGCTAYARFHGRPRWIRGDAAHSPVHTTTHIADWRCIAPKTCATQIAARLLHTGLATSTWMLEIAPSQSLSIRVDATDALDLNTRTHFQGRLPAEHPSPAGPVLLHRVTAAADAATPCI